MLKTGLLCAQPDSGISDGSSLKIRPNSAKALGVLCKPQNEQIC